MPDLDSQDAARAFDFYRSRSAHLLGGIAGLGKKGKDGAAFWGDLVLRLAVTEPAVRHAVLALSSLHERACTPRHERGVGGTTFALAEYGKSIAAVRAWNITTTEPAAVPLLVCVLFICIEFLTNYESAAQLHILQGRHILSQLDTSSKSPAMSLIKDTLVPIYARLALSSFLFASRPERIPIGLVGEGDGEIPLMFETMSDAKDWLFWLVDEGLRFTSTAKPLVYNPETSPEEMQVLRETQHRMLSQFARWNAAYTVLKTMLPPGDRSKAMEDLLMVYYHTSIIWVSTALTTSELAHDDHMPAFAAIISHASAIIALPPTATPHGETAFIFDTEMIPVLYWVVTRCRHPLMRRAALRLLGQKMTQGCRENLWRADKTYAAAKRVIQLEEDIGLDADMDMLENYDFDSAATMYFRQQAHPYVPLTNPPLPPKPIYDISEDRPSLADIGVGTSISPVTDGSDRYRDTRRASPSSNGSIGASSPGGSSIGGGADMATASSVLLLPMLPESSSLDPTRLEAPFGLCEDVRVKNTVLGKRENGGVWVTTFRNPRPGEMVWDAKLEFLKFEKPW
jgi:hypothetical protein